MPISTFYSELFSEHNYSSQLQDMDILFTIKKSKTQWWYLGDIIIALK